MSENNETPSAQLLSEYESQLSEINELLAESPEDESLLKLKSDLLELISLTEEEVKESSSSSQPKIENLVSTQTNNNDSYGISPQSTTAATAAASIDNSDEIGLANLSKFQPVESEPNTTVPTSSPTKPTNSKKSAEILNATFSIPPHLLPLPSDTEAERNRKKRTIKALKTKFRSNQKSVETQVKQKSWQDFNKKVLKKRKKVDPLSVNRSSIFATEDGIGAKVGVITGSVSVQGAERGGIHSNPTSNADGNKKRIRHAF